MAQLMPSPLQESFRFCDFELDTTRGALLHRGRKLKLQPQPFRVLAYLLAQAPAVVSREQLGEAIWGSEVHVDLDQSIGYCIRQIRQVLDDSATEPIYIETLPRQGYRFIGHVSHPESAPKFHSEHPQTGSASLEDGANLGPSEPDTSSLASKNAALELSFRKAGNISVIGVCLSVLAVLLVLASAGMVWRKHLFRSSTVAPSIESIAVLPIENLSGDPSQNYFADGMTDELTTMLAKHSTLRITSRTSAMLYKGVHRPLRDIARELGVDGILEGSVSRTEGRVHMTLQLIQAQSDSHVWAESYDRDADDSVGLPGEAARTVATSLRRAAPQQFAQHYVSAEAHDAYLRGHYLWFLGKNEEAGKYFREATELQPDYALAWFGLSIYYGQGAGDELNPLDALPQEEAAAKKAVELDDSLAEGHLALGAAYFFNRWDWAQADREISRAIELNPRYAEAYHFRAKVYAATMRYDDAILNQKKAMELEPFERPFAMAYMYFLARQYDAAIKDASLRLENSPQDAILRWALWQAFRRKSDFKNAAGEREKEMLAAGEKAEAAAISHAFEHHGYKGVVLRDIAAGEKLSSKRYVSSIYLASLYAQVGNREKALALLEQGFQEHDPETLNIRSDPAFDFLHPEVRYCAVIEGVHFPPS